MTRRLRFFYYGPVWGCGKMTYLNRVISTHTVSPHATAFVRAYLTRITQGNISDDTWSQVWLLLAMDGLGMTHSARSCSGAFISSPDMTTELVKNLVIRDTHTFTPDPAFPQAIEQYESLMMTSEAGDATTLAQSTLTLALHSRARARESAGAYLRNKARLLSLTLPQAGSLLLAVPYRPT
jgi:hypothetical protein